jgi:hypothetical protein
MISTSFVLEAPIQFLGEPPFLIGEQSGWLYVPCDGCPICSKGVSIEIHMVFTFFQIFSPSVFDDLSKLCELLSYD